LSAISIQLSAVSFGPSFLILNSFRYSGVVIQDMDGIELAFLHASTTFNTNSLIDHMHLFLLTADGMCGADTCAGRATNTLL
jgi:hypothetical protein